MDPKVIMLKIVQHSLLLQMYSHWELKFPDKISVSSLEKTGKDLHKVTIDFNNFEEVHKLTCECVWKEIENHIIKKVK